ncbi:Lrp/AsnC family transcriptional regulator [Cellulomonas sp. C5510]|uniref:Lrp/AsnC family transcriptional regulator n=1 Tax=Cellulomonas sp. C5510 TaxID=2871170 RepID=UPI001C96C0D5|nr:Lrp/AsnC family transcriptional regulator [Cellulomonas sp. C5510]QZN85838.1 Lrp/AsnC family transcriptional regulator [Cellulomonas sp. C5510]
MDPIDEAILRELTADARLPYRELGARVGLSANAAAARVRRMLDDGRIGGFTVRATAGAGPARAGLEVFVDVRLAADADSETFRRATVARPEVLDAVHVTGGYDYLVHAVVPDAAGLDRLVRTMKRDDGAVQTLSRVALRNPGS